MTDVDKKREALKKAYSNSSSWVDRVNKMSPQQVIAVYLRLLNQGKVDRV